MTEFGQTFDSIPYKVDSNSNNTWTEEEWQRSVLGSSAVLATDIISKLNQKDGRLPELPFLNRKGRQYEILRDLYDIEKRNERNLLNDTDPQKRTASERYAREMTRYIGNLTKDVKSRRHFYLLSQMASVAMDQSPTGPIDYRSGMDVLLTNLSAIYLLVGSHNRFLAGTRDRVLWKNTTVPYFDFSDSKSPLFPLMYVAFPYLFNLDRIGERELAVIPEKVVHPQHAREMGIPRPINSVEDLLEDAYYDQHYMIPLEGAEIRFRRSADVRRIILMQTGDTILSKLDTTYGDLFCSLTIDTAVGFSSDALIRRDSPVTNLVADVYHDLVTAEEVSTSRFRGLRQPKAEKPRRPEDQPQIIYIPRKFRTGPIIDRPIYDGPTRPVEPHNVGGHRRRANMTEAHRQEMLKFERDHNIHILRYLPAGYTYVRPFTIPADADLNSLPIFMKRRIETRLVESLQLPQNPNS